MTTLHAIGNWLYHFFGLSGHGPWYGWHSGAGSYLLTLPFIGALWHAWNCHEDNCYRIGHRITVEDNGHHFRRCKKHHDARHA